MAACMFAFHADIYLVKGNDMIYISVIALPLTSKPIECELWNFPVYKCETPQQSKVSVYLKDIPWSVNNYWRIECFFL